MSIYQIKVSTPCREVEKSQIKSIEASLVPAGNCTSSIDTACKSGFTYTYSCVEKYVDIAFPGSYYSKICKKADNDPYTAKYTRLSNQCESSEGYQFSKLTCGDRGVSENTYSNSDCSEPINSYIYPWDTKDPDCELQCKLSSSSSLNGLYLLLIALMLLKF